MRKILFGVVGAATLVFSMEAWAGEGDGAKEDDLRDDSGRATAMVHRERSQSEDRISYEGHSMKPCDATSGSASGEPSAQDEARAASEAEFLRNVWSMP